MKKINEMFAAQRLTNEQMRVVIGGKELPPGCYIKCDQDSTADSVSVASCAASDAHDACGKDISNSVCVC